MVQGRDEPSGPATSAGLRGHDFQPLVLGDFELRREIGRGGMGTVYEAWQRSLQRTVALKVLAAHVASSAGAVGRFQREAQAAAKLQHPNIIPIYAQGDEHGVYYYAMELVDGKSLNALLNAARDRRLADTGTVDLAATVAIDRGQRKKAEQTLAMALAGSGPGRSDGSRFVLDESIAPCSTAAQFRFVCEQVAGVADGLQYAHERGVIHRDIKPHNLMLGSDGRLRIADFGLARMSENPGVTVTGEMLGSPMYMSPEQITEGPSRVDARTDVYSLGVTLYEWLTLRPPFDGETRERVISQIVSDEPPPPSKVNPLIPSDLETICLRAIDRDRSRRYQSAAELRDDLRRFQTQQPIRAKRSGVVVRAKRFVTQHQVAATLGLTAAVAVLAIASTLLFVRKQAPTMVRQPPPGSGTSAIAPDTGLETERDRVVAETMRNRAEEEQVLSDQAKVAEANRIVHIFSSVLPELGFVVEAAGMAKGLVRGGEQLTNAMSGRPPGTPDVPGAPSDDLSTPAATLGTPQGIVQRALPDLYESMRPQGWPAEQLPGDPLYALLKSAVDVRLANPETSLNLLNNYLTLKTQDGEARLLRGMLAAQLGDFDRLLQDADELVKERGADVRTLLARGLAHLLLGQGELGRLDIVRVMELEPDHTWAKALLGVAFLETGQMSEAKMVLDEVLAASPDVPMALFARATAAANLGSFDQAVADIGRALEIQPDDPEAHIVRGDYRNAMGDYSGALRDFDRAMKMGVSTLALRLRWLGAMTQKKRAEGALEGREPDTIDEALMYPIRGSTIRPLFPAPKNVPFPSSSRPAAPSPGVRPVPPPPPNPEAGTAEAGSP